MSRNSVLRERFSDGKKKFAPLIDPDKFSLSEIRGIAKSSEKAGVDFMFYGGSLVMENNHRKYISVLKEYCSAPVILFPGNQFMIPEDVDGLLLLSLISGRNAEMLIGRHVVAAPFLKTCRFEILPTGYILIENGHPTAVSYMSNTTPIPAGQDDIAMLYGSCRGTSRASAHLHGCRQWRRKPGQAADDKESQAEYYHPTDHRRRYSYRETGERSCRCRSRCHCCGKCHRKNPFPDL